MRTLLLIFLLMQYTSRAQVSGWDKDAAPLHSAEKALTDVIVHDIFSPPVASRIYAYANIAAYEILAAENHDYHSLHDQLRSFPAIPQATGQVCLSLSAVQAFLLTGKTLVFSEAMLQDSINTILRWYYDKNISKSVWDASLAYAQQVSTAVIHWAALDNYKETRSLRRYNYLKQEGKWIPTPPTYMAAVEPYWSRIRSFTLDSASQFRPAQALSFSTEKTSTFYRQALEVYNITRQLSAENMAAASFWDCNPFAVSIEGHLNFATKKISPGGHWISIAGIACRQANADVTMAAAVYCLTSIILFDAFIICWDEKYRSNVIRPESYINRYIDESWRPLLQTPPFPEYSSGHSVISTAAAAILTSIFGDNAGFDDDTEVEFGIPVRHFNSFTEACNEAALSRLYGGIHYRAAIENGQQQGMELGRWLLKKIRLM